MSHTFPTWYRGPSADVTATTMLASGDGAAADPAALPPRAPAVAAAAVTIGASMQSTIRFRSAYEKHKIAKLCHG